MAAKVLLVEDDRALREALADTLSIGGHDYRAVDCAEAALLAIAEEPFGLVVSDVNMPGMDGHQLLAQIRQSQPQLPVLLMTAYGAVERAVDAMRQGAADYLVKPFEPKALLALVERHALGRLGKSEEGGPVALEPASVQLLELASRVAQSDSTVLITGESGTGKEVLARYIHQQSPRTAKPFIAINCAAIPDNMLEATLFGHEKGSFTGAIASAPGKFELADGGTILLDEISEMPLGLQAKLLRVLQEREVERVGGRKPISLNIRVLATSNRDLASEVAAGRFREDLYYRLSVFPLAWKPLRERPADIVPLAERLLAKHVKKMNHAPIRLSPQAQACLVQHAWPGNVRELDNAIQRALILQQGGLIQPQDLCLTSPIGFAPAAPAPVHQPQLVVVPSIPQPMAVDSASANVGAEAGALGEDLRRREFQMIIDTLRSERGRRKEAAERLGISPRTLRYKLAQMRDAGMDVEAYLYAS
ncbi:MAG: sigma-54-dependent response regulator transcription factor FleR [Pseudomonas sp.]|uniref:sigma-54-dependent response regulator transcription factor FleR n=1 Tax=Pseudomonas sp. TaxID=306 RepID=UPI003D119C2A